MSPSLPRSVLSRIENGDPSAISVLPNDEEDVQKKTDNSDSEEQIDPDEIDFSQSVSEVYPRFTAFYCLISNLAITVSIWLSLLVFFDYVSITQLITGQLPVALLNSYVVYGYFIIGLAVGTGTSGAYLYIRRAPSMVKDQLETGTVSMALGLFLFGLIIYGVAAIVGPILLIGILLILIIGLIIFALLLAISPLLFLYGLVKFDGSTIAASILIFAAGGVFVALDSMWPSGLSITTETQMLLSSYSLALLMGAVLPSVQAKIELEEWLTIRGELDYLHKLIKTDVSRLEADAPMSYDVDIDEESYDPARFETTEDALSALKEGIGVIDACKIHQQTWKDAESIPEEGSARTFVLTAGHVTHPTRCETDKVAKEAADLFGNVVSLCRELDFSNERYGISTSTLNKVQELEDNDFTTGEMIDQLQYLIQKERARFEQTEEYIDSLSNLLDEAHRHFKSSDIAAAKDSLSEFDESVKDVPQASEGAVADLKEEATELRERIAAERIEEKLSNARLARKQSNDALDNEEYNNAIERVKEGLEACRKAEQIQEKEETSEAYAIESIREDLKTHHNEAETIAEQLQNGRKHREAAREALKLQSHEKAENELALLQEVLDELSDYHNSEIDELRTASVEIKEEIEAANKKIDVDEVLNSISSNVTEAENLIEEASFAHAQEQLESAEQTLQETLSQIGSDQSESQSEIETKRNQIESAISLVEEARTQRQSAQRASQAQSYDAAESEISKLQTTIKKIADHDELSVSHDELQQSVTPLKKKIEIDRAENRLNELLGSITSSISRVEDFINESAYDRAIRRLESVLESVDEASKLNDQYSLGKGKTISQKRDQVETLFSKSEQEPKIKHSEYVSTAEEAISRGIDRREADDPAGAVEAFAEAKDNYSEALKLAQTCDLPELWETEERHSMVVRYLETAREGLDERRQSTQEELEQTLENAESTVRRAEQHADVEDHRSVQESLGDAINHLDEATQLLNVEGVTEKLESRYENLVDRADALNDSLPDEEESGKYRNQELVESLQLLATKIGESPRPEFVNKYGEYPADAYLDAFGSWPEALAAANLDAIDESARDRRTYSRVDVLDEVVKVAKLLGHLPTRTEMNHHGEISATTVENRFQDWDTALEIGDVAQKIDSEDDGELETTERSGVTKEPTETNVEKEISNEHESGEINETGTTSNYVVIGDITENRRLRDPIAVKVCEISSSTGDRKQAKLLVKDIEGIQCWLNVWKKHDINVTWKENNWYILTEARGKEWRNKQGEHKRQLSSTKDLSVSHTGTSPPVRGGEDVLSNESQSATSSSDEITQEDTEDTILDEVMGEFEETGK